MTTEPQLPWDERPVSRTIACGEGWWPIIAELDADLRVIDPEHRVLQVKEKFGGLRYYVEATPEHRERVYDRIALATQACTATCEECGRPGHLRDDRPWWRTLCDEHAARDRARFGKATNDMGNPSWSIADLD